MARARAAIWAGLGAAGAAAALAASPGAYAWVRRIARLEDDRRFYGDDDPAAPASEAPPAPATGSVVADDPAGDLRLSLHARLADAGTVVASAPAADAPVVPPPPAARPVTGTVDEARARFLGRTASATRDFDAPATPLDEATEEL